GVDSPASLWQMLCDQTDAIGEMPAGRFDVDAYYDSRSGTPGKIVTRRGGFLPDVDRFDAAFFNISPREAAAIDPQQRLLLMTGWEAIEDAGIVPSTLAGSQTGVFVGMWTNEYADHMNQTVRDVDLYVTTGGGRYSAPGRLSYAFDLRGPSLSLDT